MKRLLVCFFAVVFLFPLVGCQSDSNSFTEESGNNCIRCPSCGEVEFIGTSNCSNCGKRLPASQSAPSPQKPVIEWDGTVASSYESGNGTPEDPYEIATAQQLARLSQETNAGRVYPGQYFYLSNHILLNNADDLDSYVKNNPFHIFNHLSSSETDYDIDFWTPIGTEEHPFTANFDGKGYTIFGLLVDDLENDYSGLFGLMVEGSISNLSCRNAQVRGTGNVGCLVACISPRNNTTINIRCCEVNCYVHALARCYSEEPFGEVVWSIRGSGPAGGIAGLVFASAGSVYISDCVSSGAVENRTTKEYVAYCMNYYGIKSMSGRLYYPDAVGGIVGEINTGRSNDVCIQNCANYSGVLSYHFSYTGGIVGFFQGNTSVTSCFNIGPITKWSDTEYLFLPSDMPLYPGRYGAIVGRADSSSSRASISNCYYLPSDCSDGVGFYWGSFLSQTNVTSEENLRSMDWLSENLLFNVNYWKIEDGRLVLTID